MTLQIVGYADTLEMTVFMEQTISHVDNWERVLRKMYDWVWEHCNQDLVVDLFAIMIDANGYHERSQAWAVEYSENYPNCDLPFI